jgi:hypothetical protein
MSYPVYQVPAGDVLPIMFSTYDGGTGASLTMTGLAVTDIEIYKDGSVTQRASDAGYTLLDTDGIDFDGVTGIHGFSIDTGDNTDASFYTVGAWFHVVVSAVTVDAQTVSFIAAAFRLMAAESVAGKPKVDVDAWLGTAAATPTVAGVPEVDVTHWIGTAAATPTTAGVPEVDVTFWNGSAVTLEYLGIDAAGTLSGTHSSTTADLGGNAPATDTLVGHTLHFPAHNLSVLITAYNESTGVATFDDITATGITLANSDVWVLFATAASSASTPPTAAAIADAVWDEDATGHQTQGTFGQAIGDPAADTKTIYAAVVTDATGASVGIDGAAILADTNELQTDWANGGRLDLIIDATLADTNELQTDWANGGRLDLLIDGVKAKTDSLTFTVAGEVDANAVSMNNATILGAGTSGDKWRG